MNRFLSESDVENARAFPKIQIVLHYTQPAPPVIHFHSISLLSTISLEMNSSSHAHYIQLMLKKRILLKQFHQLGRGACINLPVTNWTPNLHALTLTIIVNGLQTIHKLENQNNSLRFPRIAPPLRLALFSHNYCQSEKKPLEQMSSDVRYICLDHQLSGNSCTQVTSESSVI